MNDIELINKILNNQELTTEEIKYIIKEWRAEERFNCYDYRFNKISVALIYKIYGKYYSIRYQCDLIEHQESYYPAQVAARVEKVSVTAYEWKTVK